MVDDREATAPTDRAAKVRRSWWLVVLDRSRYRDVTGWLHDGIASVELEEIPGAFALDSTAGAEEAVGADLGEASGEDVLEEAANEGVHRQRQAPGLPGARVGVAEGDMAMVEAFDAVVGEGDAVDVAGEIEGGVGASAHRLTWTVQRRCHTAGSR